MLLLKKMYVPQKRIYAPLFYVNPNRIRDAITHPRLLDFKNRRIIYTYSAFTNIDISRIGSIKNDSMLRSVRYFCKIMRGRERFYKISHQNITLSADFKTTMSPGL